MNMDNQNNNDIRNNNDIMNSTFNNEDSVNSDDRNRFIENEQSDLLEMNNNGSKETADDDYFSKQKETTLAADNRNFEDVVLDAAETEDSAVSVKPNYEVKNETVKLEKCEQTDHSDCTTTASYKARWSNPARLNKRLVKRYLDNSSDQMVIFSNRAYNSIVSETYAKNPVETGGILLGYVLDNGFWLVTEAIPPGKSSVNQYAYFEYDTEFVNYVANRVALQFKYPPQVLGLWHRHPGSMDTFSSVDDRTNTTFSNKNRTYGAISALVNLDPKFRITIYHAKVNEYNQVQYQKMPYEVGDEYIPDEYFELKYVAGTSKSHDVQNANDAQTPEETLYNCRAVQEKAANSLQNQETSEYTLKRINITLELIMILFLAFNIAIFIQNQLINPLTAKPFAVQTAESAPVQQPADSSTNLLKDQLSVVQPTFIHFEQPSEILAAYSLTRPQFPVQLTNPLFDCQPAVLQELPLTVQIPLVKDWACMIKEWINILSLLNEKNQVSVHNAQELIPEDVRSEPDVEKQNLESGLPINTAAIPRGIFE